MRVQGAPSPPRQSDKPSTSKISRKKKFPWLPAAAGTAAGVLLLALVISWSGSNDPPVSDPAAPDSPTADISSPDSPAPSPSADVASAQNDPISPTQEEATKSPPGDSATDTVASTSEIKPSGAKSQPPAFDATPGRTAAEAQAAQQQWADYLGYKVIETNSIGMQMVMIPPGEFLMGSPDSDPDGKPEEKPQMEVTLTQPFFIGATEVTQPQWEAIMNSRPWDGQAGVRTGPNYPASTMTWEEAEQFCEKLTAAERNISGPTANWEYRLLTEAQWEYCCRSGTTTPFTSGTAATIGPYAWTYGGPGSATYAREVGTKKPNAWGLFDMHGNVAEWCRNWYYPYTDSPTVDPEGPATGTERIQRGQHFGSYAIASRSAFRSRPKDSRNIGRGLRVGAFLSKEVLANAASQQAQPVANSAGNVKSRVVTTPDGEMPPPFVATTARTAAEAQAAQQQWADYLGRNVVEQDCIHMELALIPPGAFLMGAPDHERYARDDEKPLRKVTLTRPFYVGKTEVTQEQWEMVMGTRPWSVSSGTRKGAKYPASYVTWHDVQAFCEKLTEVDRVSDSPTSGWQFRLLTEAEWEYACRAGTQTATNFDPEKSPFHDNMWWGGYGRGNTTFAREVGQKIPNAFGLHDMHGNVHEWCSDWYVDSYLGLPSLDPTGPAAGTEKVFRGGSWGANPDTLRSAVRLKGVPEESGASGLGFRVAAFPAVPEIAITEESARHVPKPVAERGRKPDTFKVKGGRTKEEAQAAQTEWADYLGYKVLETNSIGMQFSLIPPGTFTMGSPDTDPQAQPDEKPQIEITLTKPYFVATTEVTQLQWETVMGTRPWTGKKFVREGGRYAATYINWDDAQQFCQKLTELDGRSDYETAGWKYQLPTEAEWEYACRAGTTSIFAFDENDGTIRDYAVFGAYGPGTVPSDRYARPVAAKLPNAWGLYDMHGNLWEWCRNWYTPSYAGWQRTDPTGPATGNERVGRSGSWGSNPDTLRSAVRSRRPLNEPGNQGFGIRVVVFPE